jgi:tRNA pseudouridine38-40 synthase
MSGERRLALLLEYDGTAYRGSQYQANGPSIQGELESAIQKLTGEQQRIALAGRTDTGVHALGQVAAFDTSCRLRADEFINGLNHFLPPDVAVRAAREVEAGFDPRRAARHRVYRYRIDNRPVRSPLERHRAWHVERALDVGEMQEAARALVGAHDFAAFAGPYEGSTQRTLDRCEIAGVAGGLVTLEMESRSFLPHQVRRTAGALAEVGLGRMTQEQIAALLAEAKPASAGPTAPGHGLYLVRVEYEGLGFEQGKTDGTL